MAQLAARVSHCAGGQAARAETRRVRGHAQRQHHMRRHAPAEKVANLRQARRRRRRRQARRTPRRPLAMLREFVVGDSNCLAYKAAEIVAERPGTYSPLAGSRSDRHGQDPFAGGHLRGLAAAASAGDRDLLVRRTVHHRLSRSAARQRAAQLSPQVSRRGAAGHRRRAVLRQQEGHAHRVAAHGRDAAARRTAVACLPPIGRRRS